MSKPPGVFDKDGGFVGHVDDQRSVAVHRTVGPHRAWSFDAGEWCYPDVPCDYCLSQTASPPPEPLGYVVVITHKVPPIKTTGSDVYDVPEQAANAAAFLSVNAAQYGYDATFTAAALYPLPEATDG